MISLLTVASESEEFFNELLFGSGALLGLLLIIALMLIVALLIKYSAVVLIPFGALMIVFYLDNADVNSSFMWASVIMVCALILIIVIEAKRK